MVREDAGGQLQLLGDFGDEKPRRPTHPDNQIRFQVFGGENLRNGINRPPVQSSIYVINRCRRLLRKSRHNPFRQRQGVDAKGRPHLFQGPPGPFFFANIGGAERYNGIGGCQPGAAQGRRGPFRRGANCYFRPS